MMQLLISSEPRLRNTCQIYKEGRFLFVFFQRTGGYEASWGPFSIILTYPWFDCFIITLPWVSAPTNVWRDRCPTLCNPDVSHGTTNSCPPANRLAIKVAHFTICRQPTCVKWLLLSLIQPILCIFIIQHGANQSLWAARKIAAANCPKVF